MKSRIRAPRTRSLRTLGLACSAGLIATASIAQTIGVELQGPVPPQPARSDSAALPVPPAGGASAPTAPRDGPTVALRAVLIEGNRALSTEQLLEGIGPVDGRRFTLAQLYELAERITALYRAKGYPLAQALVPAQRLGDGVLRIQVVEGVIGGVQAIGDDPKRPGAQPFLDAGVPLGAPVRNDTLERTMLLLDDQPGFRARPVLKPGAQFGETDLVVGVERRNRVSGEVGLDNTGNETTGEYRLHAAVNVNSPFRFGDRLSFTALVTDRSLWLGQIEYETPVDATGTRAAAGISRSSYQLGGNFAALDASGLADTAYVRVSRALLRSQRANALGSLTLAHKVLEQRFEALDESRGRSSDTLAAALQFDRHDALGGGGITYGQVTLTAGRLKLDVASRALDAVTAQTAGGFGKLNVDLARIQSLPAPLSLYGRFSGQWSEGNLDASEKFGLGGHAGVRAYPMGEGSGDRGWLVQGELRMTVAGAATAFLWGDAGQAQLNAKSWDAGSATRRGIAGAGVGGRVVRAGWSLESTLGWRVRGGKPEAETRDRNPRLDMIATYRFD